MSLSEPQRRALAALSPSVLRQLPDLGGVRERTLHSLCKRDLARCIDLKPATWLKVPYHRFYVLTDEGAAILRGHPFDIARYEVAK